MNIIRICMYIDFHGLNPLLLVQLTPLLRIKLLQPNSTEIVMVFLTNLQLAWNCESFLWKLDPAFSLKLHTIYCYENIYLPTLLSSAYVSIGYRFYSTFKSLRPALSAFISKSDGPCTVLTHILKSLATSTNSKDFFFILISHNRKNRKKSEIGFRFLKRNCRIPVEN